MKSIYFDNGATTRIDDGVLKKMMPYFTEKYGNASSSHFKGKEAKEAIENSRRILSKSINAKTREIVFTSGGTEANNFALKGLFFWNKENNTGKNHIIVSKIDHDCVLNTAKWLESQGAEVDYLDVDSEGFVNIEKLKSLISDKTILVSIIHGNNEIGTIQDLESIGRICRDSGVLFHTDACQSYTKTEIDVKKQNLDLVTLNAHKIHGPKGVGALYIREGIKITPFFNGGGHERGFRSGTENVHGIVGFAEASKLNDKKDIKRMVYLREKIIEGLLKFPGIKINGPRENRLANNINVCFGNIEGEAVGGYLEAKDICTSTGSACSSHNLEPSHVLQAIGLSPLEANSSIRITISRETTEDEVNYFLEVIEKIVNKLRRMSPLVRS